MSDHATTRRYHDDQAAKMLGRTMLTIVAFVALTMGAIPIGYDALNTVTMLALPILFFGFLSMWFYHEQKSLAVRKVERAEQLAYWSNHNRPRSHRAFRL